MGLILIFYVGIGLVAGLLLGIPCMVAGSVILMRRHKSHERIWPMVSLGFCIGLVVAIGAVQNLPLKPVRPGNDYDVAAFNLLVTVFGYTMAPALAFLIGSLFTGFCRQRSVLAPPPLPGSGGPL